MELGTVMPIHRHKGSSETCICIRGHFEEYFYDAEGRLTEMVDMVPGGVVLNIEKGQWHSLKCLESGMAVEEAKDANEVMWYATQARDAYPYYQHTAIGYNYRMSNVCAGIGRGQMKVLDAHIAHHKHVQALYEELLKDVPGVHIHKQPADPRYDANFWLCAATLGPEVRIVGQENAYKEVIKTAVGGAAGVIHQEESATTDCQPNENVEALRVFMLGKKIEARPTWKPMHKQPVYAGAPVYTNGIEEELFKVGFCLPAGPYVTDEDVRYIVDCIKEAIEC